MKAQRRRAKPNPKAPKRKGPHPDPHLKNRLTGYVPRASRAHPAPDPKNWRIR